MKVKGCLGGSIDHRERSRLAGDGRCPWEIPGIPCARDHPAVSRTTSLDERMLLGEMAGSTPSDPIIDSRIFSFFLADRKDVLNYVVK